MTVAKNRQRVLLVARSLQMGGVERNTVNLADSLAAQGHEVHILLLKDRQEIHPDPAVKVHVFDVDKFHRRTGIGLLYDFVTRGFLRLFVPRSSFFWRGLYGGIYFRFWLRRLERRVGEFNQIIARGQGSFEHLWSFSDPRFVTVVVSPFGAPRGSGLEKLYTRVIYANRHIVVNSTGTKGSLEHRLATYGVRPRSIHLIPNPVPVAKIKRLAVEKVPLPSEPYVVHVGRLTHQKNQELLIRAYHAAAVAELLVIVGTGQEESRLRLLAQELGVAERVLFVGQKENPYPWMKGARLFVLSSRIEGFGLVMAEALACGTQVLAVDCPGGVRDVLIDEQVRNIAEPTVLDLAAKLKQALALPLEIKKEWYERFDAERIAEEFLQLDSGFRDRTS